ncbi:MAG TPA: hypothetical protein VNZ53_13515 [Steroidobacteraceae bacterium]|jgi:hypothetical protein|nr:hypothetical protein [Steroidobacteraceae bacterium]
MPTKRVPLTRIGKNKISSAAIEAFRRMQKLKEQCTCPEITWEQHFTNHEKCKACKEWWVQNSFLCRELRLPPWKFPAYQHPDATTPYPEGSPAAISWKPDLEAQDRYRALEQAAAECQ